VADDRPVLSITGSVSLRDDTIYVNGMYLAALLDAFAPVKDSTTGGWRFRITVEDLGPARG
jgi:hypothetical protein